MDKHGVKIHRKDGFTWRKLDFDGLVQNCSNSIANALELLQYWTKPSILSFR